MNFCLRLGFVIVRTDFLMVDRFSLSFTLFMWVSLVLSVTNIILSLEKCIFTAKKKEEIKNEWNKTWNERKKSARQNARVPPVHSIILHGMSLHIIVCVCVYASDQFPSLESRTMAKSNCTKNKKNYRKNEKKWRQKILMNSLDEQRAIERKNASCPGFFYQFGFFFFI